MTLPSLLVTDTNIWIDLENGGILANVFKLPYQYLMPDFAISELIHPKWYTLQELGVETRELAAEQVAVLYRLRPAYKRLSITDLAAFLLAKTLNATLLTGDWRLSELATINGLSVHGVLWLLDEMVRLQALAPGQAADALQRMLGQGARLPLSECRKRLAEWSI